MAAFLYRAVDPSGRKSRGVVEASSAAAARSALRSRNLLPVAVEPTRAGARGPARAFRLGAGTGSGGGRMPLRKLALATRQIATLIGADVRIEDALRIVADQSGRGSGAPLLLNLRASVLDGRSFAAALDDYPATFGDYYRASVRAGENAGRLSAVMEHLADHIEDQARNRQTLQLALVYPALLAVVSLSVIVGLLTFVVPDIVRVFTSRGAELPFLTRALIATSDAVTRHGPVAAALAAAAGLGAMALLRRPGPRMAWHRTLASRWPTRGLVRKANTARFTGTLATLVQSRVPLADALPAASGTVPNLYLRRKLDAVAARVRDGAALSSAIREAGVFPPMLQAMIVSGEAGGTLGHSLARAADDQSRDLKAVVATVVALVEPGVLLVMGGIVMLLVLAILMPIINLNTLVG